MAKTKCWFDIETDDYLSDWQYKGDGPYCLSIGIGIEAGPVGVALSEQAILDYLVKLDKQDVIIGHNIIRYDLPFLKKVYGWTPRSGVHKYDTLILSQLLFPDRQTHSLDSWGKDFGIIKPVVPEFRKATPEEIVERVTADVLITKRLFYHLTSQEHAHKYRLAYELEAKVAELINQQEQHGVNFDVQKAKQNIQELDRLCKEIEDIIEPQLPERKLPASQVKYPPRQKYKKDGTPTKPCLDYFGDRLIKTPDGSYMVDYPGKLVALAEANTPLETAAEMKLINRKEIKKYLQELGWEPTLWNTDEKGNRTSPKIHENGVICPDLIRLGDTIPSVKLILKWNTYQSRRNVIESRGGKTGLLTHPRLKYDGRLPASANTLGAVTRRMTHKGVANIPRVTSLFGREMREMFIPSKGMVQVGWDASSLEECMKAHYVYSFDPEYANRIIRPGFSPHDENADLWGVSRDLAKNGLYALTYGCSPARLAVTLKKSPSEGQELYDIWWDKNAPLLALKDKITREWMSNSQKFIIGLDGAPLHVRKPHALLNTLFQSAGIIVMKRAMVLWHEWREENGWEDYVHQTIHYHDEAQAECIPKLADAVGQKGVDSIVQAGVYYDLNVALSGEYAIGNSWADTH